jgi:histidine ammonia-lyase
MNSFKHAQLSAQPVVFGLGYLCIEDIIAVAERRRPVALQADPAYVELIAKGPRILQERWQNQVPVYGVTTGVGDSCTRPIPRELVPQFSRNLSRFHGCGLGRYFEPQTSAAIVAARLASLTRGYSAVRYCVLERLCTLLDRGVFPMIPEEGSVGASGDLTPLSYVAGFLMGERNGFFSGEALPSETIHQRLGLRPLELLPKEGLALMNGTAVMTALACFAFVRAERLSRVATRVTSMLCEALFANRNHFDLRIFKQKPFAGQYRVAARIGQDLNGTRRDGTGERRLQDTYSIRCAPHIIGVLEDALPWLRQHVETELNSSNDNPLIDPDGDVLHGGNFYGGHIAFAMDCLKIAVANIADLLDRQMALVLNQYRNSGLPANLSGAAIDTIAVHHGFKAVQIGCSAWAAEALRNTTSASIFSRSTESHNQDKVSMGTIAARDAIRVLELTEQVLAGTAFAAVQAIDCRIRARSLDFDDLSPGLQSLHRDVRQHSEFVGEDRPLEADLRNFLAALRTGAVEPAWDGASELREGAQ